MPNTIGKCIIITFSIVNNPYSCHPCMFITENCCSKFMIMSFWAPARNCPAGNGIPKKPLDMSLAHLCKMMISPGAFFIFLKILFFGQAREVKGQKNSPKQKIITFVTHHISGTVYHIIIIFCIFV